MTRFQTYTAFTATTARSCDCFFRRTQGLQATRSGNQHAVHCNCHFAKRCRYSSGVVTAFANRFGLQRHSLSSSCCSLCLNAAFRTCSFTSYRTATPSCNGFGFASRLLLARANNSAYYTATYTADFATSSFRYSTFPTTTLCAS